MLWISAEQWASHSSSRSSSRVASRLSEKLSTRRSFSTSHLIRLSVRHSSHSLATLLLKLSSSKKKSKPPLFTAKSLFWLSDLLSVCRLSSQSVQGEESTSQLRKGHKFASFFFFLLLLFENFTLKSCTVFQIRLSTFYSPRVFNNSELKCAQNSAKKRTKMRTIFFPKKVQTFWPP